MADEKHDPGTQASQGADDAPETRETIDMPGPGRVDSHADPKYLVHKLVPVTEHQSIGHARGLSAYGALRGAMADGGVQEERAR